tara:strand:- start:10330 stop:10539 length:210 start_codon:yes stop_codon:yes gene_type:complete
MNNDITEISLLRMYDDLQKEQLRLMNDMKNDNQMEDKDTHKQITMLNTLTMGLLRLRNLRKQIEKRKDN